MRLICAALSLLCCFFDCVLGAVLWCAARAASGKSFERVKVRKWQKLVPERRC